MNHFEFITIHFTTLSHPPCLPIYLSRKENIYITNTVFWRPPANRRPTKQEIEICQPFLEKHIALINPKLLICVGSTAVSGLLGDLPNMSKARQINHLYQNRYLNFHLYETAKNFIFRPKSQLKHLLRQNSLLLNKLKNRKKDQHKLTLMQKEAVL